MTRNIRRKRNNFCKLITSDIHLRVEVLRQERVLPEYPPAEIAAEKRGKGAGGFPPHYLIGAAGAAPRIGRRLRKLPEAELLPP